MTAAENIAIHVYDVSSPKNEQLLYIFPPSGQSAVATDSIEPQDPYAAVRQLGDVHWTKTLDVGGRQWVLVLHPTAQYQSADRTWGSWGLLGAGVLFSVMAATYLLTALGRAVRVERLVAKRSRELVRANEELEREVVHRREAQDELGMAVAKYRAFMESGASAIFFIEPATHRFLEANRAAEALTGYSRDDLLSMTLETLDPLETTNGGGSLTMVRYRRRGYRQHVVRPNKGRQPHYR